MYAQRSRQLRNSAEPLTPQERAETERQMGPINAKLTAPQFTTEEWRKLHVEKYALEQILLGE